MCDTICSEHLTVLKAYFDLYPQLFPFFHGVKLWSRSQRRQLDVARHAIYGLSDMLATNDILSNKFVPED